jgi:hypothetical protein
MELEVMPERINVMWVSTYGVDEVIQTLKEDNRILNGEEMNFTLDDVILYIENETLDMMRNARARDLIFQDQNGDTLDDY